MKLSVVVSCHADWRVFDCIESIDEDVDVIVVLVPNQELEQALRERSLRVVHTKLGNYSLNCNLGIKASVYERVVLMDSDCVFEPGCLRRLDKLLNDNPLARARVCFQSSPRVLFSRTIARTRSAFNNRLPIRAYSPGLGLCRDEVERALGGLLFHECVFWSGDSEFSRRVTNAGLKVGYDPEARIIHSPISLFQEIRSAHLLGQGNRVQTDLGLRPNYETIGQMLRKLWPTILLSSILESWRTAGAGGPMISCLWAISFYVGYFSYPLGRSEND